MIAVLAASLLSTACGGSTSQGNMSFDDWHTQADAVCTQAVAEAAASRPVTGAGNPAVPVRAQASLAARKADDLAAVGRPTGRVDDAETLVAALDDQSQALDRLADALLQDPTATSGPLQAAATVASDRVEKAAGVLDLASCAPSAAGTTNGTDPAAGTGDGVDEPIPSD